MDHHKKTKQIELDWIPDKNSTEPVYKQIVSYFCQKISSGDWTVGSILPSQRKMSELFGVNRSTIVSAMEELSAYGAIQGESGKGTVIASNTWSILMSSAPPDWGHYIKSGYFRENITTIQTINKQEFKQGIIRLGTGELSPSLFPSEMMRNVFQRLPNQIPSLNYLGPLGLVELREALSKRLASQGIKASPSSILITSGSLQALQLISLCILKRGSTVYTESPTYLKSLQLFQSAGIHLKGIPMDKEGIAYWQMKEITKYQENSLVYTIPTFHNPTGAVMTKERRTEFYRFCSNHRLPIIEDNAYGELWIDEEPPKPIKTMDNGGNVLYLGTISKTMAPGLRIGWIVGPSSVIERLGDVKMQIDYGASSLSQWAMAELLSSGSYDEYLLLVRSQLKRRRDLMIEALNKYFKGIAEWNIPKGSFYVWLKFKLNINTDQLFAAALKENILINPGSVYDFTKNKALRLSYSYVEEYELEPALKKLSELALELIGKP